MNRASVIGRVFIILVYGLFMSAITVGVVFLFVLIVKALKRDIKSSEVREAKGASLKTLGAVIKKHRADHKMTQDFVAEYLGVSRQAVSKWESGGSHS